MPITISPDRSPWRDATALFQASRAGTFDRRPAAFSQIAQLVEEGILERRALFQLDLHGLASNKAAIDLARTEHMPLPLRLLVDPEQLAAVQTALAVAQDVHDVLRASVWLLARYALASGALPPDKKHVNALVDRLASKARYWARLGARFDLFLRELVAANDTAPVVAAWKLGARSAARDVLRAVAEQLGTQARTLQARAYAERHLAMNLADLVPSPAVVPANEGAHE